ncbi:hypothetical protein [Salipaludibacillus daqingensis]|uniref:hypothetical protein n=1 Tax=Salipaludibacillus daqingensis TaxID=3041001 RepID=UPI00247388D3|nr:hypothetical protein [Salipaludibacillus daqingensis]
MKIMTTTLLTVTLLFGAASFALADDHGDDHDMSGKMNVGQMKNMHSDLTIHEFKDMYKEHHGTLGAAPSKNFVHHMHNGSMKD